MNRPSPLKWFYLFPIGLLFGCVTPNGEEVITGAERYLSDHFGRPYHVIQVESTFNEGNMNPNGFRITAAPRQEPREIIAFKANYIDGVIKPTGTDLGKLVRFARQRLLLSRALASQIRQLFPKSHVAVVPNIVYEEIVTLEVELYLLPIDEIQKKLFADLAEVFTRFVPLLDFKRIKIAVAFLAPQDYTARQDGLMESYFTHHKAGRNRALGNIYKIEFEHYPINAPVSVFDLSNALKVNGLSSRVQGARGKAQRWLEKHLKAEGISPLNIGLNRIYPEIAGPIDHIRFEFANCEHERHPKRCPEELKTIYRVIYRLYDHHISLEH